jgi:hypothetical protein
MFDYINDLPLAQLVAVVCLTFIAVTWFGAIFIRPFFRLLVRTQPELNSLIGSFVSMYGMFYGILMGLLAVAAYQNTVDVEDAVVRESTALSAFFRSVTAYPETVRRPFQESVRDYTQFVINVEWPEMRKGNVFTGGRVPISRMQKHLNDFEPATPGQTILHTEATKQFYRVTELAAERVYSARTGIPGIMWYVVILGAFVSIFLTWMLNMSLVAHLFLGSVLSFFIGTMVSLIIALGSPLRGAYGVDPDAFQVLLQYYINLGLPPG